MLVFAVLASAFSLSVGLRASRNASITGDEPFYLATTQSLIDDGDLDLWNQYEYQTYRSFFDHPDGLWRQAPPTADGRVLSPHDPGLSVLLIPGFALGGLTGAQVELLLIAALTYTVAFLLGADISGHPRLSALATVAVALSAPGFVYATEIYPEMPAALLLLLALATARAGRGAVRPLILAAVLTGLAWLGAKYVVPGAVIAGLAMWEMRRRDRAMFAGVCGVSAAVYAWWHLRTFGALTPYSGNLVYDGQSTLAVVGSHFEFGDRVYRLWGLFVDERFGIGRWAPALLAVPVMAPSVLRAVPASRQVVAVVAAQLAVATFLSVTMMGWWFPGRMLIAVFPMFAIIIAAGLSRAPRALTVVWGAAAAFSMVVTAALVRATYSGDVTIAVDPFGMPDFIFLATRGAFPDYSWWDAKTQALNAAWLALLAMAGVSFWMWLARPCLRRGVAGREHPRGAERHARRGAGIVRILGSRGIVRRGVSALPVPGEVDGRRDDRIGGADLSGDPGRP